MMAYWPLPNATPSNAFTQTNNYSLSGVQPSDGDRIDSRVDHVFSDRWRSFVRYSYSNESSLPFNSFGNPASSSGGDGPTYTEDAQPVDRSQLFVRADLGAERALRPEPPPRGSPAAVGRASTSPAWGCRRA